MQHLVRVSDGTFLVGCDPACPHQEVENNLSVVLVQPRRVQGLRGLSLLLLEVVGKQARLVADVVGGSQLQVVAELLLVAGQDVVAGQAIDGQLKQNFENSVLGLLPVLGDLPKLADKGWTLTKK